MSRGEYLTASERLRGEDAAAHGENAILASLLPTADRIRHSYGGDWEKALRLAALQPPGRIAEQPATKQRASSAQPAGMPIPTAVAFDAAINGRLAVVPTMMAFAAPADSPWRPDPAASCGSKRGGPKAAECVDDVA